MGEEFQHLDLVILELGIMADRNKSFLFFVESLLKNFFGVNDFSDVGKVIALQLLRVGLPINGF